MARYIDEKDVYRLVEPTGIARVHCSQIDELPRADVVPKSKYDLAVAEREANVKGFTEQVEALSREIKALRAFKEYWDELYGQGLTVAGWHENGAYEDFDNFYDCAEMEYDKQYDAHTNTPTKVSSGDVCVVCGEIVPEGRQV